MCVESQHGRVLAVESAANKVLCLSCVLESCTLSTVATGKYAIFVALQVARKITLCNMVLVWSCREIFP